MAKQFSYASLYLFGCIGSKAKKLGGKKEATEINVCKISAQWFLYKAQWMNIPYTVLVKVGA